MSAGRRGHAPRVHPTSHASADAAGLPAAAHRCRRGRGGGPGGADERRAGRPRLQPRGPGSVPVARPAGAAALAGGGDRRLGRRARRPRAALCGRPEGRPRPLPGDRIADLLRRGPRPLRRPDVRRRPQWLQPTGARHAASSRRPGDLLRHRGAGSGGRGHRATTAPGGRGRRPHLEPREPHPHVRRGGGLRAVPEPAPASPSRCFARPTARGTRSSTPGCAASAS